MMDVSIKECDSDGLYVCSGASQNLSKLHNEFFLVRIEGFVSCGVWLQKKMVLWWNSVANKRRFTTTEETASPHTPNPAINIYIPSRSITALVHDNEERDLYRLNGGKIQSQLSSSSLELTVIHPVAPVVLGDVEENQIRYKHKNTISILYFRSFSSSTRTSPLVRP